MSIINHQRRPTLGDRIFHWLWDVVPMIIGFLGFHALLVWFLLDPAWRAASGNRLEELINWLF